MNAKSSPKKQLIFTPSAIHIFPFPNILQFFPIYRYLQYGTESTGHLDLFIRLAGPLRQFTRLPGRARRCCWAYTAAAGQGQLAAALEKSKGQLAAALEVSKSFSSGSLLVKAKQQLLLLSEGQSVAALERFKTIFLISDL